MEHIQKDDIIIRKEFTYFGQPHRISWLSSQLLEMEPDLMEFVRGHIFKIMESDDAKRCQFNGSVSPVLSLLESMKNQMMRAYRGDKSFRRKICLISCVIV